MKKILYLLFLFLIVFLINNKDSTNFVEVEKSNDIIVGGKYKDIVTEASKAYDIDPKLVLAIIRQESGGNPNAIGSKGEIGLMQLMPGTARDMGVKKPFDPRDNIFGGTRYLRYLLDIHDGNLDRAITSYNIGPNGRSVYQGYAYLRGVKNNYRKIQSGLVF